MKAKDAMAGLTPLDEAQKIVLETTPVLGLEKIPLLDALGRVLGEDIIVERDNPPWDNSAMDGFAVRWDDIKQEHAIQPPVTLTIIEDVPAFSPEAADAVLRFVTLIDICYERRRRVIVSAAAYPDDLYPSGPVEMAFRRAASRLAEMQAWA